MLTYGVVLLHDSALLHTAARTRALLEHSKWDFFIILLTALTSLQATTTCLPISTTGRDHSSSTIMRNLWKCQNVDEFTGGNF
jgi:hypothetical protein